MPHFFSRSQSNVPRLYDSHSNNYHYIRSRQGRNLNQRPYLFCNFCKKPGHVVAQCRHGARIGQLDQVDREMQKMKQAVSHPKNNPRERVSVGTQTHVPQVT